MTADNAASIAALCGRLDGLPLAIELAAAHVRVLPPTALLARLAQRLPLPAWSAADLPERQHSLEAAIRWSYRQLSPAKQSLLRRLGVFVGGWTLDAAASICFESQTDDSSLDTQSAAADGLAALVDKSLVTVTATADPGMPRRFGMLETIRAFALAELTASGELTAAQQRHARYFLQLAERSEPMLQGPEQVRWLERLEEEHANLRAALGWTWAEEAVEVAARFSILCRFWIAHNHIAEGRQWLELMIGRQRELPATLRARLLQRAGALAQTQGSYAEAQTWYEESLTLFREQNDTLNIARTLNNVGIVAQDQGDLRTAQTLYEESLAYLREMGNKPAIAQALNNLGLVAYHRGDNERAHACHEESLAIRRELCDTQGVARVLANLARVAGAQGDDAAAMALYAESLPLTRALGSEGLTAYVLESIAELAVAQGRVGQGLRFLGAAAALRESLGAPVPPVERATHGRTVARARRHIGDTAAEVWAAAQALTADQALGEALAYATGRLVSEAEVLSTGPGRSQRDEPPARQTLAEPLTKREHEVLGLVAEGLSNKQIAARLSLSPLTVRTHLAAIFGKLAVPSRTAAVHAARRLGLL